MMLKEAPKSRPLTVKQYLCILILFSINLLNFMDRYTIASILTNIQTAFEISDDWAGFLQTVFMIFFMFGAPTSGYLADRYERKWIVITGLIIWVAAVFASSFVPTNMFWLFVVFRGVVGIGEASYVCVAPSIIADMFSDAQRSRVLTFFYFATPVGCGLGFIIGSLMADLTGDWRWGIRLTPFLGVILILATVFFINEPPRESADDKEELAATSLWDDLKYLATHKTYLGSTVGSTVMVFSTGTLAFWMPSALEHAFNGAQELEGNNRTMTSTEKATASLYFGAITCVSGAVGVLLGTILSQLWKDGKLCFRIWPTSRADALVCGLGALISIPFVIAVLQLMLVNTTAMFIIIFFETVFFCFNWSINIDLLLYTIIPRRRSTATALQNTAVHLFGDCTGPYIVGFVSNAIQAGGPKTALSQFTALRTAFYIPAASLVLGGLAFFYAGYYVIQDKRRFDELMGYENEGRETVKL